MVDEFIVVVGQQTLSEELWGFPAELHMTVVVSAFKVLWRFAIVVHHVGLHTLFGIPCRNAIKKGLHVVMVGA